MMAEETECDRGAEIVEVSVDLFVASMSLEESNERAHLEFLRKAQAHLTNLILDPTKHGHQFLFSCFTLRSPFARKNGTSVRLHHRWNGMATLPAGVWEEYRLPRAKAYEN